ncbi:hypothetical protein HanIR_Chr17g0864361 [Helianthus annuus]|nr:hypothetical protein HanIR_Chr17g0864361 [Helianthus annuus]
MSLIHPKSLPSEVNLDLQTSKIQKEFEGKGMRSDSDCVKRNRFLFRSGFSSLNKL